MKLEKTRTSNDSDREPRAWEGAGLPALLSAVERLETNNGRFAILAFVNDTEALKKTSTPLWVMDHD